MNNETLRRMDRAATRITGFVLVLIALYLIFEVGNAFASGAVARLVQQ